ncbi:nmrA-like family domain-containing protein 1 [Lepisosteus oculatus]|uniref:nmrA-like family domain-containing protein 1 n=1 Tax=Lepisosteus oculatus TaxID=7918 RepID=UPI000740471E|nr:PREDICTED: nmrA-like family domain-containing protein 1 [Lepisosteus oculatus]XP_015210565.1 PREDICTED: nmrA-like family domain-containing protein 1 [Lepisosteus oculatus]
METVVVLGADKDLGQSVVHALLQDGSFAVRAAVQDTGSPLAQQLQQAGSQIVAVNFKSASGLQEALRGAQKCFASTTTDFTDMDALKNEIHQGYLIADACKQHGLKHVVFQGGHHVHRRYGFPARHMDAKACVNDYMNEISLPKTELILPFLYESFLTTFKPKPAGPNFYKLDIPAGETPLDAISVKHVGLIASVLLKNSHKWIGKSCPLSAERLTVDQYATTLNEHLQPRQFKDSRISVRMFVENYNGAGGEDLGNMFEFWKKGAQKTNVALTHTLCPETQRFSQWVSENKDLIINRLEQHPL